MAKVERTRHGIVTVLKPLDSLYGDETAEELDQAISEVEASGDRYLVLNLERATNMNSRSYGMILHARDRLRARGVEIRLCCLRERVLRVGIIMGLVRVFHVYETEAEAIASFIETVPADAQSDGI